jgi:hypothetical protein
MDTSSKVTGKSEKVTEVNGHDKSLEIFDKELGDVGDDDITVSLNNIDVARIREAFLYKLDARISKIIHLKEEKRRMDEELQRKEKDLEVSNFFLRRDREALLELFHRLTENQKDIRCDECGDCVKPGEYYLTGLGDGDRLCEPCYNERCVEDGKEKARADLMCSICGEVKDTKKLVAKDNLEKRICISCSLKKRKEKKKEQPKIESCLRCGETTKNSFLCDDCEKDSQATFGKEEVKCCECGIWLDTELHQIFYDGDSAYCGRCHKSTKNEFKGTSIDAVKIDHNNPPPPHGVLEYDAHMKEYLVHCFSCGMRSKLFKVEREVGAINGLIQNGFELFEISGEARWLCNGCSMERKKINGGGEASITPRLQPAVSKPGEKDKES